MTIRCFKIALVSLLLVLCAAYPARTQNRDAAAAGKRASEGAIEEGVIKIDLRGYAREDLVVGFQGDSLFVPFRAFCEFLRIISDISPDLDSLSGTFPVGQPFLMVRTTGTMYRRSVQSNFPRTSIYEKGEEVYVERSLLESCLGIRLMFSIADLTLRIDPDVTIPLVDQTQRSKRYAALSFYGAESEEGGSRPGISRQFGGSVAFDWQLYNLLRKGANVTSGGLHLGGPFMFGTLELFGSASYQSDVKKQMSASLDGWLWRFALPDFPLLRRLTIGSTTFMDTVRYLGEISNVPLSQNQLFDLSTFDGYTQPGWSVELYDGAQLIQVAHADSNGYYRFDVPVRYGINTMMIHEVGDHGEVILRDLSATYTSQMLPPGRLDYTSRLLVDRLETSAPATGTTRLQLGVTDWLTLEGVATLRSSVLRQTSLDSLYPACSLYSNLGGAMLLGLGYDLRSKIANGRIEGRMFSSNYRLSVDAWSLDTTLLRASGLAYLSIPHFPINIGALYEATASDRRFEVTPQVIVSLAGVNLLASGTYGWEKREGPAGDIDRRDPLRNGPLSSSLQLMTTQVPGLFLMVGGFFDHIKKTPPRLQMEASTSLFNTLHVNLKYSVDGFRWKNGTVEAMFSLDLDQAQVNLLSTYSEGQFVNTSAIGGSMLVSSAGVQAIRNYSVGQSTIIVTGFHDANGNGVRDPDEESLGNPRTILRGGGSEISAKAPGEFYNITADMGYDVDVDKWSFAGEGLFPRRRHYTLYTMPSTVHVVQVPFSEGFDVSGNCRMASSGSAGRSLTGSIFNGLRISLVSPSGDAMYDGEIFSDGSILISGVAAGEYRVEFDQRQLESRGLEAEPRTGSITLNPESALLPDILLRTRSASAR